MIKKKKDIVKDVKIKLATKAPIKRNNNSPYNYIFSRLREARINEDINQATLGELINKDQPTIFHMETRFVFALDTIIPLINFFCKRYGYNINWFIIPDISKIPMKLTNQSHETFKEYEGLVKHINHLCEEILNK